MIPPGLERPIERAARRREARGRFGDAKLTLDSLTPAEADALDGLPWPSRPPPFLTGQAPTIHLVRLEAALEAAGLSAHALYEEALGRPWRDRPAEGRARRAARERFRDEVLSHPVVLGRPALRAWAQAALASGRLSVGDRELIIDALRVMERLPARDRVDRALLAADLFDGRPHSLDVDRPLERVTRSMLAACQGLEDGERQRAAWHASGVDVDTTASTVLTLGLAPRGHGPLEAGLRAQQGSHVVLTFGQLEAASVRWPPGDVRVCENPSVLRAAERTLGARCPPLVCGAGWPTDAVRLLLDQLCAGGATLRYHGDFDATGVAIFRLLENEAGVIPWLYDAHAYEVALAELGSRDLPSIQTAVPGRPGTLEAALSARRREIPEELLIPELLADLEEASA